MKMPRLITLVLLLSTCSTLSCSSSIIIYPLEFVHSFDKNSLLYVIGHQNPDTDAVCSSIAYASFLSSFGYKTKAVIPSNVNGETEFVLNKFNVDMPSVMNYASSYQFSIVDHGSYGQAIDGMKDASIVAVIDHHEIGDIETDEPIFYKTMPVGSSSTIIYYEYVNYNVSISKEIAGLMFSAILSDTLGLKSPTTTKFDLDAINALMPLTGINDYHSFTKEMLDEGNVYDEMTIQEIFESDYKNYVSGGTYFSIGSVISTHKAQLNDIENRLNEYMKDNFPFYDVDMCFFMLVNVDEFCTKLLCYGEKALETAQKAFNVEGKDIILNGVVSRKLQVVPPLKEVLE